MALGPPDPMLADEAIRLVPLKRDHEPALADLVQDEDVRTYTRVPTEPPPDFVATWLGTYVEGWGDGSRVGFAIETHDGEFLGLGLGVLRSYWFKEEIRRDFGIWSRLRTSRP